MFFWELANYRLSKEIPDDLTFEERKLRLLNSEGWRCSEHQQNKHRLAHEITEDNIQEEISTVVSRWGMDIIRRYQKLEWFPYALNSEICEICIP